MTLADGLYDELLTEALQALVVGATQENGRTLRPLQVEDAPRRLADLLATQLVRILDDLEGDGEAKLRRQLELVNSILLRSVSGSSSPTGPLAAVMLNVTPSNLPPRTAAAALETRSSVR